MAVAAKRTLMFTFRRQKYIFNNLLSKTTESYALCDGIPGLRLWNKQQRPLVVCAMCRQDYLSPEPSITTVYRPGFVCRCVLINLMSWILFIIGYLLDNIQCDQLRYEYSYIHALCVCMCVFYDHPVFNRDGICCCGGGVY